MTGQVARPDEPGGLLPLLRGAARLYYAGEWTAAQQRLQAVLRLAVLLDDRATARDARLMLGRVLEQLADWAALQTAAEDLLAEEPGTRPTPARAVGLGLLATALQQQDRITDALAAAAEGHETLVQHGPDDAAWATHRAMACITLSTPLSAGLLFDPALELLAAGEALVRRGRTAPWVQLTPARFASRRARTEALQGFFMELLGDDRAADGHYAASAAHAVRALAEARPGSLDAARAAAGLALALQRLRVEPVDRSALERHVEVEPFPRAGLLTRLTLASVEARGGDFAGARDRLRAVRDDAAHLGELVAGYVATSWLAQLDEAEFGPTPATRAWRRVAEATFRRLWDDRVGRFEAIVSARRVEQMTEVVERERRRIWEDALTSVGNRRLLERLLRRPEMAALPAAFIDVDWFKSINDRFGHAVGDEVLRRIASLISAASRAGDVITRYGGDEFVVLLGEATDVEAYCERVRRSVAGYAWETLRPGLEVTVTVGGVQAGPRSMMRAEAALRRAKRARVPDPSRAADAREWPA